jgi:hypothetical protein
MKKRKLAASTVNEDGTTNQLQLDEEGKDEDEGEDDE